MHAMFEPSAYFLDPTSEPETTTSFLSFASFADLDFTSSAWNIFSPNFSKSASDASDTSSPSPSEPCQVIASAFDAPSPVTDIGIFHTPAKAGPSKLSGSDSSVQTLSHRSSTSSEGWNTPLTPSLTTKSSSDSFHFATGNVFYLSSHRSAPFSWDDASTTLASSSYESPTPAAHRTTSNLTLGSSRLRPPVKPVVSMPALKEEVASTPSQWFDGTEYAEASTAQHVEEHFDGAGYVLTDDFDSVFGDYGLGDTVPAASTIFAAFHSDHPTPCDEGLPSAQMYEHHNPPADMSWLPGPSTQDVSGMGEYDFSTPSFTINPIAVMATSGVDEQPSRPSSAPRLNGDEGSEQMLSVPMGDMMTRSVSSDAYHHPRSAPPRDLFSYAPQQMPSAPPAVQPLYTTEPSPSYNAMRPGHYPRTLPPTPTLASRRVSHQLSIQINPPQYSTFMPSPLPPTPQSGTFLDMQHAQATHMVRAGTQPLPTTSKLPAHLDSSSGHNPSATPAHLLRAQAMLQMQEAKEDAQRQELRRQASARRVWMAEASVMQPQFQTRPRQTIMGWEGPSAQTGSMPIVTTTPLVTVHPPPASYFLGSAPSTPHRVHPPPHPGTTRPIARMPSPIKRKASNYFPSKVRSPSGKRKPSPSGGAFSWGETTFINFTPEDADKLLTGVAPSGSQSKRKREEDALREMSGEVEIVGEDRERSKVEK